MNQNLTNGLIKIILVAILATSFYFYASPYEDCMRENSEKKEKMRAWCTKNSAW